MGRRRNNQSKNVRWQDQQGQNNNSGNQNQNQNQNENQNSWQGRSNNNSNGNHNGNGNGKSGQWSHQQPSEGNNNSFTSRNFNNNGSSTFHPPRNGNGGSNGNWNGNNNGHQYNRHRGQGFGTSDHNEFQSGGHGWNNGGSWKKNNHFQNNRPRGWFHNNDGDHPMPDAPSVDIAPGRRPFKEILTNSDWNRNDSNNSNFKPGFTGGGTSQFGYLSSIPQGPANAQFVQPTAPAPAPAPAATATATATVVAAAERQMQELLQQQRQLGVQYHESLQALERSFQGIQLHPVQFPQNPTFQQQLQPQPPSHIYLQGPNNEVYTENDFMNIRCLPLPTIVEFLSEGDQHAHHLRGGLSPEMALFARTVYLHSHKLRTALENFVSDMEMWVDDKDKIDMDWEPTV